MVSEEAFSANDLDTLCEGYLGSRSCNEKSLIDFATETSAGLRALVKMERLNRERSLQANSDGEMSHTSTQIPLVKYIVPLSL